MNRMIQSKTATRSVLILVALFWVWVVPEAKAVIPAPDGGYPGFNTAEGQNALFNLSTGVGNAAVGWFSLSSNTDGSYNTAVGVGTLLFNVGEQSTGEGTQNTAIGAAALLFNITGANNTAIGSGALQNNTADNNTATGVGALLRNTTGEANTATGTEALKSNTTGSANTAAGDAALFTNTSGDDNTAVGTAALFFNTGSRNTAIGRAALFSNSFGSNNTATGHAALENNTSGPNNTATGYTALRSNTTGLDNTAVGSLALLHNTNGTNNTAVGFGALLNSVSGDANTALGWNAGVDLTGTGNVCIGQGVSGDAGADGTTWIRNVNTLTQNFSAGVNDYVTVRLTDGRLGHTAVVSSQRYKEDIKPLAGVSEALYALRPVSFRLKKEYDETQAIGFGLIAEEVENVDPALVYCNNKGQVESVRYEMVNAMLLNEFLKEHEAFIEEQEKGKEQDCKIQQQDRKIQEQVATIAQLKKEMETVLACLKEHDAKIRQVSDQIEPSGSARRVVSD
jgi:trimeric autotransporter adhesin